MSATVTPILTGTGTFRRTYQAQIVEGDGRTLEARVVPYNVVAEVADPPDFRPYREMFVPGAFEKQLAAPDRVRVWLNFEHQQGLGGIVGHGVELSEEPSALAGRFRVHENADGDKALQLYHEGLLTGLSLEFAAMRSRVVNGVTERLRAHIHAVSLCRFPAYQGAAVLAARQGLMMAADEDTDPCAECGHAAGTHVACGVNGCPCNVYVPDGTECASCGHQMASHVACSVEFCDCEAYVEADDAAADQAAGEPAVAGRAAPPMPEGLEERLAALGITPLGRIAKTSQPWSGDPGRFTDEQYRASTLHSRPGPKEACLLPVLEPDGTLNVNALGPAAAALNGARAGLRGMSQTDRAAAARKLVRYYNAAGIDVPPALRTLASS
jgi:HK97 family phage prohead protease